MKIWNSFQLVQHQNKGRIKYVWTMFLVHLIQLTRAVSLYTSWVPTPWYCKNQARVPEFLLSSQSTLFFSLFFWLLPLFPFITLYLMVLTSFSEGNYCGPAKVLRWFTCFSWILMCHCKEITDIWRCLCKSKGLFGEKISSYSCIPK